MSFNPSVSTIHNIFESYMLSLHDISKSPYSAMDTIPYIVSYLQQLNGTKLNGTSVSSSSNTDTIATIKSHERSIEQLTQHISLLTLQINSLTKGASANTIIIPKK